MGYIDQATLAPAMKELYGPQEVRNLVLDGRPLLALLDKDKTAFKKAVGKSIPQPIIIGVGQGASATFSYAQANQSGGQIREFNLTRARSYSLATISQEAMEASDEDVGSFLNGHKFQIDGAFTTAANRAAMHLYRDGTGQIGTISTITAAGFITLTNADDAVNFEIDQTLQAISAGAPLAAPGYVVQVDSEGGTLTVSNTMGGNGVLPTSWAATMTLCTQGDFGLAISGIQAWLPQNLPNPDNFFGVNRVANRTRLAGIFKDYSALPIEEAVTNLSAAISKQKGKPDHAFVDFTSYAGLERSIGTKIQYTRLSAKGGSPGTADIGFKAISYTGRGGELVIIPDVWCPPKTLNMLQIDTWTLYSIGDVPHITTMGDGLPQLRVNNADANELRVVSYYQLGCGAPGWNGVALLAV